MQPLPLHHEQVAKRFAFDFVTCGFGQTESGNPLAGLIEEIAQGEGTPAELYRGLSHGDIRAVVARYGVPVLPGASVTREGFMGVPTPFVEAAVLTDTDEFADPEQPGHLAFRPRLPGLLVQEYLGKPGATLDAFRNLWFHTGDAAPQDAEGNFYFVDRLGDRIRVRDGNISSFQVEDLLNQHEDVEMSAVFPVAGREGDEDDVAAYVVPRAGGQVEPERLLAWARATMPKFMVPRHLRVVPDLPRTPTNKVEKYKLRAMLLAELQNAGDAG